MPCATVKRGLARRLHRGRAPAHAPYCAPRDDPARIATETACRKAWQFGRSLRRHAVRGRPRARYGLARPGLARTSLAKRGLDRAIRSGAASRPHPGEFTAPNPQASRPVPDDSRDEPVRCVGRGRRRAPSCSYPPAGSSPALPSGHALECRALGSRRGLDRPRGTGSASRLARGEGGLGHADQVPRCERVVLGAGLPQGGIADRRSTLRAPGEPCPPSLSQALHDGIPSSRSNANKCFCRDKVLTGRLFVRASRRTTSPGEPSA